MATEGIQQGGSTFVNTTGTHNSSHSSLRNETKRLVKDSGKWDIWQMDKCVTKLTHFRPVFIPCRIPHFGHQRSVTTVLEMDHSYTVTPWQINVLL